MSNINEHFKIENVIFTTTPDKIRGAVWFNDIEINNNKYAPCITYTKKRK